MVDVPDRLEDVSEVVIFGVESEQIEEENDAYNDLRAELGEDRETSSVTFELQVSTRKQKMTLQS